MTEIPKKLDNSYLANPTVNTVSDLLEAMKNSKAVFQERKTRFASYSKSELKKAQPNHALLAQLDYELKCDLMLFNLAEQLISNTQYVEARLQDEFDYLKNWLRSEQMENIKLVEENFTLKLTLKNAS